MFHVLYCVLSAENSSKVKLINKDHFDYERATGICANQQERPNLRISVSQTVVNCLSFAEFPVSSQARNKWSTFRGSFPAISDCRRIAEHRPTDEAKFCCFYRSVRYLQLGRSIPRWRIHCCSPALCPTRHLLHRQPEGCLFAM